MNKKDNSQNSVFHPPKRDLDPVVSEKPQQNPRWGWISGSFPETKHFAHTRFSEWTMPGLMQISDFVAPEQPDLIMGAKYLYFTAPTKVTGLGP